MDKNRSKNSYFLYLNKKLGWCILVSLIFYTNLYINKDETEFKKDFAAEIVESKKKKLKKKYRKIKEVSFFLCNVVI